MRSHIARFIPVAGIERGLAAASLGGGEFHAMPQTFKHLNRADRDVREQLIHKAGNKEGEVQGGRILIWIFHISHQDSVGQAALPAVLWKATGPVALQYLEQGDIIFTES